jgi:hypothetical protein
LSSMIPVRRDESWIYHLFKWKRWEKR